MDTDLYGPAASAGADVQTKHRMEAVGRLACGVAHDVNTLMAAITCYADLLIARLPPEDAGLQDAYEVRRAALTAARLTRRLLAQSRGEIVEKHAVDLNTMVSRTARILKRTLPHDVAFDIELDPRLLPVEAAAGQIEQIVLNLAVNARDAMPRGGRLGIRTSMRTADRNAAATSSLVCLEVTDTGCGIPAALRSRIFEPFFTTKGRQGTGLGLATVKELVADNRGHIELDSAVDCGTRFRVLLPAMGASTGRIIEMPQAANRGRKILVVEDDAGVRTMATRLLRRAGHEVVAAAGPEAALSVVRQDGHVNLVVSDVVMPGMDGYQLARALRTIRPGLKFLFISGRVDEGQREDGMFLAKPFTAAALTSAVCRALAA